MSDAPQTTPPDRAPGKRASDRGVPWKLVLWGALAVYAVVFLLMNSDRQDVSFVFFTVRTRLIWLILLSMVLGGLLATVGRDWLRRRSRA